jgi:hypothetical protein
MLRYGLAGTHQMPSKAATRLAVLILSVGTHS